jgi:protein-S-isoprenylcysteine O-methyltransferase Ste14
VTDPRPAPPPQSAGVPVDPQLIYAVPLVAGVVLERWLPTRVLPARFAAPVGIALSIAGIGLCWAVVRKLRAVRTTLQPWETSTALVTDGPFRLSRNPVYLGYSLIYLGIALWVDTAWPLFFLPIVVGAMHWIVIAREEAYLEARFGDEYRAYRRRARRWL